MLSRQNIARGADHEPQVPDYHSGEALTSIFYAITCYFLSAHATQHLQFSHDFMIFPLHSKPITSDALIPKKAAKINVPPIGSTSTSHKRPAERGVWQPPRESVRKSDFASLRFGATLLKHQ